MKSLRSEKKNRNSKEWRKFEVLVAAIEEYLAPQGAAIKSPDWVRDADTDQMREVDASVRFSIGGTEMLITIECRDRSASEDVTWIEQLATKRTKIGAAKTIAVSSKGFSKSAQLSAGKYEIELKVLKAIEDVDMDEWFAPIRLVYPYKSIERFMCEVECSDGTKFAIGDGENRFRHFLVNGGTSLFPGAAFVNFLEHKNPDAFIKTIRNDEGEFELTLPGVDCVPDMSDQKRTGLLEVMAEGSFRIVDTVSLKFKIAERVKVFESGQGSHYTYGSPQNTASTFSQFEGEVRGFPMRIERLTKENGENASSISFPGSPRMPIRTLNPRITDISRIDTTLLCRQPIGLKIKNGEYYEGELFRPQESFFKTPAQQLEFDKTHLIFMEKSDVAIFRHSAATNSNDRVFYELARIYPRDNVEYVDLTPLLKVVAPDSK